MASPVVYYSNWMLMMLRQLIQAISYWMSLHLSDRLGLVSGTRSRKLKLLLNLFSTHFSNLVERKHWIGCCWKFIIVAGNAKTALRAQEVISTQRRYSSWHPSLAKKSYNHNYYYYKTVWYKGFINQVNWICVLLFCAYKFNRYNIRVLFVKAKTFRTIITSTFLTVWYVLF